MRAPLPSFQANHRASGFGREIASPISTFGAKKNPGDGVITGYGTIDGPPGVHLLARFHRVRRQLSRRKLQGDAISRPNRMPVIA